MKKKLPQLSVLFGRMQNIGNIELDTKSMIYYGEVINRIRPQDMEELSISWVENLLNPHPKTDFMDWRKRIELVNEWFVAAKADEVLSADFALMMDIDALSDAILRSVHELAHRHAINVQV